MKLHNAYLDSPSPKRYTESYFNIQNSPKALHNLVFGPKSPKKYESSEPLRESVRTGYRLYQNSAVAGRRSFGARVARSWNLRGIFWSLGLEVRV